MISHRLALFLFLTFFSGAATAEFQVPTLRGPVMDEVRLLKSSDRRSLERTLVEFNQRGTAQVQVLIVPNLGGEAPEQASIRVFDAWQLGDEKRDNGVLFLVSTQDRQMRIEVGRGLEGAIPDVVAKRILADQVAPLFRAGRFSEGVVLGVSQILALADQEFAQTQPLSEPSSQGAKDFLIFLIFGVLFVLVSIMRAAGFGGGGGGRHHGSWGHGSPWGGGGWGGGGGGWSGGGGSSAGGGASSGW